MLIGRIASDDALNEAFAWVCHTWREYPANSDIWCFRRNWASERQSPQQDLSGRYRFEALERAEFKDGPFVDVWTSRDALVVKALTVCLADVLPVSSSCNHVIGHGEAKEAHAVWSVMWRS